MGASSHLVTPAESKPAPLISPPNTVALSDIITGCKLSAKRLDEPDPIRAEVLGIRPASSQRRSRFSRLPIKIEPNPADTPEKEDETLEFYLHWIGYNKRLDEWVAGSRIHLDQSLEWPVATPTPSTSTTSTPNASKQLGKQARKSTIIQKKRGSSKLRKVALKNSQKLLTNKKNLSSKSLQQQQPQHQQQHQEQEQEKQQQQEQKKNKNKKKRKRIVKNSADLNEDEAPLSQRAESESMASEDEDEGHEQEDHAQEDDDEDVNGHDEDDEDEEEERGDAEEDDEEDEDEDEDEADSNRSQNQFSKQDEIEKLRTSGSMTQSHHEISRVKNLDRIQIGKHEVEAWYFSPYPIEFAHIPILYICEFCLSFYGLESQIHRHRSKCTLLHPPGNEIYRSEEIHFFEIDGRRQKTWCRNLSLLSKCFLDHKTLYYDVDPFLYYVMCQRDYTGLHLIGYFSKEKESAENYNVACILTLPQYQRLGFGKLLIEFSYELSKKEGKLGSPEKPLSDLGLLSYRAYWEETIVGFIVACHRKNEDVSIDEIAQKTAIVHSDVMHVCQTLQLLKYRNKQHIICLSEAIIERCEKNAKKNRRRIQPNQLIWKPPTFSRAQLQFGF